MKKEVVNSTGDFKRVEQKMAQIEEFVHVERISMLMEMILSRENLLAAFKRVDQNKGSHGVDGNVRKRPTKTPLRKLGLHSTVVERRNLQALTRPSSRNPETERRSKASRDPYRDRSFHPTSDCPSVDENL